ncbi:MAG: hypothetical protein Ta2A_06270 [Treponemataceae bacterium]|nr:MAG: hypothetical protein Ta2A_06270 [Treponemataceae bacterium]
MITSAKTALIFVLCAVFCAQLAPCQTIRDNRSNRVNGALEDWEARRRLTPEAMLQRVDYYNGFDTIYYDADITVVYKGITTAKKIKLFAELDTKNVFIEFLNKEDYGTKYLKENARFYVNSQKLGETMLLSDKNLDEPAFDSNFMLKEFISPETLFDNYTPTLVGTSVFDGRTAWLLDLKAKTETAFYPRQRIWLDKETYDMLHAEYYNKDDVRVRLYDLEYVEVLGDRRVPSEIEISVPGFERRTVMRRSKIIINEPFADDLGIFDSNNLQYTSMYNTVESRKFFKNYNTSGGISQANR